MIHRLIKLMQDGNFPPTGWGFNVPAAGGNLFAWGTTVPSAVAGYAPGCLFIDYDAAAGQQQWINEGSATSCTFVRKEGGNITLLTGETLSLESGSTFTNAATSTHSATQYINNDVSLYLGSYAFGGRLIWDSTRGAVAITTVLGGFVDIDAMSDRYCLKWQAGQRGLPGINGDIQNAAEATRMIVDPDFEILGTNATSDDVTYHADGGILFTTDGADGDGVILLPHLDAGQSPWTGTAWSTDQEVHWECWIKTGASIGNCIIWAGLKETNTDVIATDDDSAFFRYENGVASGKWQINVSTGGSDDTETSGTAAVAINTAYHLRMTINSARQVSSYINGELACSTSGAMTDTFDTLIPYIGVEADGATEAKTLIVRQQMISRKFT